MKMIVFGVLGVVAVLAILFVVRLWGLGRESQQMTPAVGLEGGRLRPCSGAMHCVSSVQRGENWSVEPLSSSESADQAQLMERLSQAIRDMGGVVKSKSDDYLHSEFTSGLFGFVDDLEVHIQDPGSIQVRSESRVGKSDLGANRKRVEALRQKLQ